LKEVRSWGPGDPEEQAMPNYTFCCDRCKATIVVHRPFSEGPSPEPCECGGVREHDFRTDVATIECDTSGCRDHNVIERSKRVYRPGTRADADRKEASYARHISERRGQLKDGNKGKFKQSHAIPADLYHGKIRETGDKQYWNDKKNMKRHSDFKVG
jgi:predicted nucleic acid-binding Zn ribbon protein